MDIELVIERVRRVADTRGDHAAEPGALRSALRASAELRSWLAAADGDLIEMLRPQVAFPEQAVAESTRVSLGEATKATERATTLAALPGFAVALDDAEVMPGHIDAITRATRGLDDAERDDFLRRVAALADVAAVATVRQFAKRLDHERRAAQRGDGMARVERQRRAVSHRSWTDADGMYCYAGRLDPLAGVEFDARIAAQLEALFAQQTPDTCPTDPVEKQRHLAALALVALVTGQGSAARSGRPDYVVVVDSSESDGAGGPVVDWGIPVEVPLRVLADLMGGERVDVHTVVVRNGVVLHAPGALNLGRTSRLANRAQRRALNALYATCAVPGCDVHYRHTKLHHVVWWENGGATDLHNLLPVCAPHHALIHRQRWRITLGPDRSVTITLPDGTVLLAGPPRRSAAWARQGSAVRRGARSRAWERARRRSTSSHSASRRASSASGSRSCASR
jgi:hypothetical protein